MKRVLAIRRLQRIIDRLYANGGVIETPGCDHTGVRVINAWLFGSLLKGSDNPGDVDILLQVENVGECRPWHVIGEYDRDYLRRYGMKVPRAAEIEYKKILRLHVPLISLHDIVHDDKVAHPRVLIYPTLQFEMV